MQFLETIKSVDGELQYLNFHQRRVDATLIDSSHKLSDILHPPRDGSYRCRVIYDKKEAEVSYHPYTFNIAKTFKLIHADNLKYDLKYANRKELQELKSLCSDYDDILIVKNSLITDTTIANVAFLQDNRWFTPKHPLLKGTTRMRLIEDGFLHVRNISTDDIKQYSGFAIMNAMIGFQIIEDGIMSVKNNG
jgi:4-amino-4-deoxychorismate lyase